MEKLIKYVVIEPKRKSFIWGKDRKAAAREFCRRTGMPEGFFEEHCLIRRAVKADREEV